MPGERVVVRELARRAGLLVGLVEEGEDLLALGFEGRALAFLQATLEVDHVLENGADDAREGIGHEVSGQTQMTKSANWRLVVLVLFGGTTDKIRSLWKTALARFMRIDIEQVSATSRQNTWSRSIW